MRVAPGGPTTICLGVLDDDDVQDTHNESSNKFANGSNQNAGNCITERSSTRLHQAPGGNSTICLGYDDSVGIEISAKMRQSPGGPTTISLTYDETPSKAMSVDIHAEPDAAGVFLGPPNGQTTLCLGTTDSEQEAEVVDSCRQAPGGSTTICLQYNPSIEETPSKLQPPGGDATICLGVDDDHVVMDVPPSGRKGPGGDTSVCLGSEEPAELECHSSGFAGKQVPGGTSTICFGASEIQRPSSGFAGKQVPGGPTTISFGESAEHIQSQQEIGIPPGGKSSICLGVQDEEPEVSEDRCLRPVRGPVGGESTLCLGVLAEDLIAKEAQSTGRVAPGGAATICLGLAELTPRGRSHRQAPGGNSTICLGECVGDENINTLNSIIHAPDLDGKKANKILGDQTTSKAIIGITFG